MIGQIRANPIVDFGERRIGGWLLLPACGLGLTVVGNVVLILNQLMLEDPLGGVPVNAFVFLMDASAAILAGYIGYFLVKRSVYAPILYVLFIMYGLAATATIYILGSVYAAGSSFVHANTNLMFGHLIACFIWIPYFTGSRRVKATFVQELNSRSRIQRSLIPLLPRLTRFQGFLRKTRKILALEILAFEIVAWCAAATVAAALGFVFETVLGISLHSY